MRKQADFPRVMLLILLLGLAARLYHIQSQSIWFDEGWSAYAAIQPTLQAAIDADRTNPPLYYLLLNLAARGIGDSELALRYVSTLFGLIGIALSYRLACDLFERRAGILAALLAAINPLLWWASQEARMYTLLAALVLAATWAFHRLLIRPSRLTWVALWGAELALLYAHNTGPVIVVWLNAAYALAFLTARPARRLWRVWLAGQIGIALLWLPYFIDRFLLLPGANSALSSTTPLTPEMLARLWGALWAGAWPLAGAEPLLAGLAALLGLIALLVIPWRQAGARWLIFHAVALTAGVWLGLALLGNEIHGRYLVMIAPLVLVALAGGAARLTTAGRGAILLASGAAFVTAVYFIGSQPAYQHDDARGMARVYAERLGTADSVLMWSYADRYELAYYWPRLNVQARRITLPEGDDLDAIWPRLPSSGDVALNVWYTQRADYRGMLDCVLSAGSTDAPETVSVNGMTSLFFRQPRLIRPQLRPVEVSLPGAALTAVGIPSTTTADRGLCLPLQLRLDAPLAVDLKASVTLRNPLGWEVARADAIFADAAQRTTALLPAGSTVTAYALLRLPVGAPPGDYRLSVTLYDESAQPSGYELTAPGATPVRQWDAGVWRVVAGADWAAVQRPSDLPVTVDLTVGDLTLRAHNLTGGTLRSGDSLRLGLLWDGRGDLPALTLADAGGRWSLTIPPGEAGDSGLRLDWRAAQIPLNAPAGTAELRLPDGTVLAAWTVEYLPLTVDLPAMGVTLAAGAPSVGQILGFTLEGDPGDRSQPFRVRLVWRALCDPADDPDCGGSIPTDYTVFVQLVSADGRVLAQSDAQPVAGSRPTTGWRPGEVIVDPHIVTFHTDAGPGPARLIAGLYNAATGQRVQWAGGADFVVLLDEVTVR